MEGEYRREAEQHRPEAERRQHQEVLHPLAVSGLPILGSLSAHCFPRPFSLEGILEPRTLRPQPPSASHSRRRHRLLTKRAFPKRTEPGFPDRDEIWFDQSVRWLRSPLPWERSAHSAG